MAKETKEKKSAQNRGGQDDNALTFRQMVRADRRKRRGHGVLQWLFWRGVWLAALAIAFRFIWIGAQTRFKSARAEIVCNICGAPIRRGVNVDLSSFTLVPPWETALSAAADTATAAIFRKDASPSPSPTPGNEETNIHYSLCENCAADFFAWTVYARGRKGG